MPFRLVLNLFLLCFSALAVQAQLCAGPFSDPSLVIDFGTTLNPYPTAGKLGAGYGRTTETCTPEGTAELRAQAFMCKPEWQVTPFDHTDGDENGNFLMVSPLPGTTEVYRDTISGLCPQTVFNFQLWVLNLMVAEACDGQAADPNLKIELFDATGAHLAVRNTGTIRKQSRAEWVAFAAQFRSPGSGTIILVVTSVDARVCGSDFGIDDIGFAPCKGGIKAGLEGNSLAVQVCQDQQQAYLMQASYNGFSNPQVQWQVSENGSAWVDVAGANTSSFRREPSEAGEYAYRMRLLENGNNACAFVSNPVQVQVFRKPFAQGTNYVYGCYGFPVNFQASGGTQYEWAGPAGFRSNLQAPSIPRLDFVNAGRYRVKVTNDQGCSDFDSTDLVVYPAPVATLNISDTLICAGDSLRLVAGGADRYLWLPAGGLSNDTIANPQASPDADTRYTVKVFTEPTCYDTASVQVRVVPKAFVDAGPDKFSLRNRMVTLEGRVSGAGVRYRWSPAGPLDNANTQRPKLKALQTTLFVLEAEGAFGCGVLRDTVKVEVIDRLFIPTAFTPNGDRLNDVWEIVAIDLYPNAEVQVFDRWGKRVYQSLAKAYKPWNGKDGVYPVPPGVYIYMLNLGDGSPLRKGSLTVLQ
ncbi:gliding motility-associated C-terminal domain-containing protein [Cnuella takakiae]|uniref:Gliding motility-associated C-terminal domain-containing protein n=1 Tax=Cnuella takakiae TaxID=1302690 RepID=A0A1M5GD40_9BACT|nr:gliding motility-associated C-terminal domain-containing protein [Cnuella takakiae]OLY92373.1 hypothetical protein BUE76_11085 [Cnuella takakiae]SHG01606.1 gliding motility-associated C-terminal domain-containing protein [Cnuella takakiae]